MTLRRLTSYRALICLASLAMVTACSVTTAHLTDIKTASDKAMTTPATSFGSKDTMYAQTSVANNGDKVTVQWHVIAEKATGISPNFKITTADVNEDVNGDADSTYTLSPPPNGWPTGTYKIEADMMVDGAQKDTKSAEVTVQ